MVLLQLERSHKGDSPGLGGSWAWRNSRILTSSKPDRHVSRTVRDKGSLGRPLGGGGLDIKPDGFIGLGVNREGYWVGDGGSQFLQG